ncbi:hypothetical protein DFJ74DRAFT_661910 [Hyaloraphidium curvatum]|nr:hypothetical protein DFJ74DRAFT_661910 [Hyaloraphidium curvatum]
MSDTTTNGYGAVDAGRPSSKTIHDDIWGVMDLPGFLVDFIDTPSFKRLKRIKQLGTCYEVWTGATHNRFEHSLGTSHLASRLLNRFIKEQPGLEISPSEYRCVGLAALLHDLGHGILSHVFDNTFFPLARKGETWSHEEMSLKMFDYTVDSNAFDIPEEECRFIKDLIDGKPTLSQRRDRGFLFDIVANKRNSIDTDKWDYITRDCRNLNMPGYDIERLMANAWVFDDQICYAWKSPEDVLDFFQTRFRLHRKVYGHAVAKGYEYMYVDAMIAADEYLGISESVHDPEKFVTMTDGVFDTIRMLRRKVPELEKAGAILDKIDKRQHYRSVDAMIIPPEARAKVTRDEVTARAIVSFRPNAGFSEDEIIVDWLEQKYSPLGDGEGHPLENVKFYKRSEDVAVTIHPSTFSNVLPSVFTDLRVRCFLKDSDRARVAQLQVVFREFMDDIWDRFGLRHDSPGSQSAADLFVSERRRDTLPALQPNQLLTAGLGESSPRKRRHFGDRDTDRESTPTSSPERFQNRKRAAR